MSNKEMKNWKRVMAEAEKKEKKIAEKKPLSKAEIFKDSIPEKS